MDLSRLPVAKEIPFATQGEESFGGYARRLSGFRFHMILDANGRTVRREAFRLVCTDAGQAG